MPNFTTKEMISIFPLWIFHLYVATFQQHLHMEYRDVYISPLIRYSRACGSVIDGCCQQGSYWTKGSYWLIWSHHFESFTVSTTTELTVMAYLWYKWSQICSTTRSFPRSWLIAGFLTRVTQRMPLVGQELLITLEHLRSALPPVLSRVRVTRSLVLCVCFVDCCLTFCNFFF